MLPTHELRKSGPVPITAGAVAAVQNIKNPISLARAVMDNSEHVFMASAGAQEFGLRRATGATVQMACDQFAFEGIQSIVDNGRSV